MKASRKSAATVALLGFFLAQGSFVGCGGSFTVGRIDPLLAVMISPSDGATQIPLSANISVTFSHDVNPATLTPTSFYLTDSVGGPVTATISYDAATNTATLDPDSDLAFSAQYTIHVTSAVLRAIDGAYLAKEVASTLTTVDPPPLGVVGATPSDGSAGVPLDTTIRVTFSEGVDTSTVDAISFVVEDVTAGPLPVSGTFSFDSTDAADPLRTGDIVVFTPDSALPYSATIRVTLTTDIKSARATASGGSLSAQAVWTFQTLDPPPLEVVFTEPADAATDIPVGSNIIVTFSEDVDPSSVTATSFVLKELDGPGGNVVATASGTRTVTDSVATLDPDDNYNLSTYYQVTLTTEIKSVRATTSGGSLSAEYIFEFRTEPLGPLKVESVSPPDGQLSVDPVAVVEVIFNADIVELTLSDSTFFLNPGAQSDWATRLVNAVISYDAGTYTATLDPEFDLTGGTDYTVTVTTGVQGTQGEMMFAEFISHFRTRVSADIAYTEPLIDETGVDMDAVVLVVFTSDINTGTVDQTSFYVTFQDRWERVQTLPGSFSFSGVDPDTGEPSALFTTNAVTFTPDPAVWNGMNEARALLYDTTYTATVTTAILTTGGDPATTSDYTWSFTTGSAPVVTGTTPIDGAVEVVVIDPVTATFNVAMDPATVTETTFLVERVSDGAPATGTVSLSPDGLTATFQVTGRLEFAAEHLVTLVGGTSGMADLDANFLDADHTWTFTTSPANIVDAYEDSGSVDSDHVVVAVFSRPVDPDTVTSDTFYIIRDPGGSTPVRIAGLISLNDGRRIATFIPSPELEGGWDHTLYATAGIRDWLGNPLEADFTLDFVTSDDTDQVKLSDMSWGPTGADQPGDVTIWITFDEDAAGGTLNADSLILIDPSSNPVPGTITYLPDIFTVIFDPDDLLQDRSGTGDYAFTATNDISDLSGNVYIGDGTPKDPAPRVFIFSLETTAPTITGRSPEPDVIDVPADAGVVVTFSEDMDPASFDAATFHVNDGLVDIAGAITVEADIATFTPSAWLDSGVTYTVTVDATVCDLAGNQLGADDVWDFTVDTTAPAVSAVDPANTATDVAVTTDVTITFSEKIDAGSVVSDTVSVDGNVQVRKQSDGAKVYGLVTVTGGVLVFDPADDLEPGTLYDVVVTAGAEADVTDLAGNEITTPWTSSFTTQ